MKPRDGSSYIQAEDRTKGSLEAALHGAHPIETLVQYQHGGCCGPIGAFETCEHSDRPRDQGSRPDWAMRGGCTAQANEVAIISRGSKKERRSFAPAGASSLGSCSYTRFDISGCGACCRIERAARTGVADRCGK
jgi:hypothetical protein